MTSHKVAYIWSENLIDECNRLPAVNGRASLVHNLIACYGLVKDLQVVRSSPATYNDLKKFHSELYIDHLKTIKEIDDEYIISSQDEEYGIGYDCPPVSNMFELVSEIAGASITAAKCLVLGMANVAINWCGGWHHAQRFCADGFCYVNDIVLAIETLKVKFPKVLYVDLDVHHGNGVQDAYNLSKSVLTMSFHKYEPGFYPSTGGIEDIGNLIGKGYSCNIPLHAWYSDDTLEYIFGEIFPGVFDKFGPDSIVVQCGADALARDPHGGAKLTTHGYLSCITQVLEKQKPTVLLGGGGYNYTNAARLWASITALSLGTTLDNNIPEHEHWIKYGPDYTLSVESMLTKDLNHKIYLDKCILSIKGNMEKYLGTNCIKESFNKRLKTDMYGTKYSSFKQSKKPNSEVKVQYDVYEFVD